MTSKMLSNFKGERLSSRQGSSPAKKTSTADTRKEKLALLRRAKNSEREFARWMVKHDGPDPKMRGLTTSTGRIGHVTGIRADTLSASFIGENKNAKINATLGRFWQLICQKGAEWVKSPVLHWEPSNAKDYPVNGKPLPDLYIIDGATFEYLLACKRRDEEGRSDGSL